MLSYGSQNRDNVTVADVMERDPVTCTAETGTLEAIELMRKNKIGCLPVVKDGRLIGIVTEHDFFDLAGGLLERWLKDA